MFEYDPSRYISRRYQSAEGGPDKPSTIAATWLDRIPFQIFLTVRPVGFSQYSSFLRDFIESAERHFRAPLSSVVSIEHQPILNLHFCIASSVKLDLSWFEAYLKTKPVTFDIQKYDFHRDALPYILKTLNSGGAVDYHNLDYYLKEPRNRKDRKRLARHQSRVSQFMARANSEG